MNLKTLIGTAAVAIGMVGLGSACVNPPDSSETELPRPTSVSPSSEDSSPEMVEDWTYFVEHGIFPDGVNEYLDNILPTCAVDEVVTVPAGSSLWAETHLVLEEECQKGELAGQAVDDLRQKDSSIGTVPVGYRAIVRSDGTTAQIVPLDASHYVDRLENQISSVDSLAAKRDEFWGWYCTTSKELFPAGIPEAGPALDVVVQLQDPMLRYFDETELPWMQWLIEDASASFMPDAAPLCP